MFEYLRPRSLETSQEVIEYLALHQTAQDFRLEVAYREQFEAHCQWYYQTATENQAALARMRHEANLLAWFGGHLPSANKAPRQAR
ncbi:MAG: hypothetical protein RLZZ597_1307 [Cyanobacteriota bacterium]|jgi:hypothetical protein